MAFEPLASFESRARELPRLGLGISTEFGAAETGLDPLALRRSRPELVQFLELGVDLERGLDRTARDWCAQGWPTTYHFLDGNLEESESLSTDWLGAVGALAREVRAAWVCGDAGLWHLGPRERGHGVLAPPILCPDSARAMAENVRRARESLRLELLPENPPAHLYLGELHLLDYFARVADASDSGLLLDVAHLAIYQRVMGHSPLAGLDGYPLERVIEVHVAGAAEFEHAGRRFVDDAHGPEPLPDTWQILSYVLPRAPRLKALVFECERNPASAVLPGFERLASELAAVTRA